MKHPALLFLPLLLASLFASGCAISKNVQSVQKGTAVQTIYVGHNDRVLMKDCTNEIVTQLKSLGFDAQRYDGDRPKEAKQYLTYTANWQWDIAMYLTYFRATLYDDGRVLGEAEYDAKMGGANLAKFGTTADKLKPLLTQLLANVERPSATTAPRMGTAP
ncbi:MAG: Sbal_3080 family lipoprotein [Verrucomicrobiota bacterium]